VVILRGIVVYIVYLVVSCNTELVCILISASYFIRKIFKVRTFSLSFFFFLIKFDNTRLVYGCAEVGFGTNRCLLGTLR